VKFSLAIDMALLENMTEKTRVRSINETLALCNPMHTEGQQLIRLVSCIQLHRHVGGKSRGVQSTSSYWQSIGFGCFPETIRKHGFPTQWLPLSVPPSKKLRRFMAPVAAKAKSNTSPALHKIPARHSSFSSGLVLSTVTPTSSSLESPQNTPIV